MLDRRLISELDAPAQHSVKMALMTLFSTGVLEAQIRLNMEPIVKGFNSEPAEELAKKIVEIRETNRTLQGFHELGKELVKEAKI